jgi:hypothetical protein
MAGGWHGRVEATGNIIINQTGTGHDFQVIRQRKFHREL